MPFIVQWKAGLPAGRVDSRPVISLDIHATTLAVGGISLAAGDRPLDGVDLLPFFRGQREGRPHQALLWRYGVQLAICQEDWELCRGQHGRRCLHDLASDPEEARDLSGHAPEKFRELRRVYDGWNAELIPSFREDRHANRRSETRATAQGGP
jgi:arylsulfatase A-like enzyme